MLSKLIGHLVKKDSIRNWLIGIAEQDPDDHIMSPDGKEVYMYRYWLFNRITNYKRKYAWIPFSIRIHNIVMPDDDRHLHDHPFNARTWIMAGGYDEVRLELLDEPWRYTNSLQAAPVVGDTVYYEGDIYVPVHYRRLAGATTTLGFNEFHKITKLHGCERNGTDDWGGAWTLFMFGRFLGPWGFLVDGKKMPHRAYIKAGLKKFRGDRLAAVSSAPMPTTHCAATQRSDQMVCDRCDVGYDVNDPFPPTCPSSGHQCPPSGGLIQPTDQFEEAYGKLMVSAERARKMKPGDLQRMCELGELLYIKKGVAVVRDIVTEHCGELKGMLDVPLDKVTTVTAAFEAELKKSSD